jgi:[glutamine synthetase] adenylyltransferase / [glutamine synthetase]-adenylyl-L-tyrosine phosphorylase
MPSSASPAATSDSSGLTADSAGDPRWQPAIAHSRYLQNQLAASPELVAQLAGTWQRPLAADDLTAFLHAVECPDEEALKRRLRQLRRLVMARLMLRDLCAGAPLAEITESMTLLADVTCNFAHDFLHAKLAAQYGEPLCADGRPQRLLVIGMGKLGGRELNVSSDIDLIFVYPEEGKTAGGRLDAYEFFVRLGKRLIAAIGEITGDGQVFRVDMRLRPNGDSGPLVISLDGLENYFITQGREWERYAWIKARVMNPHNFDGGSAPRILQNTARPFIFRRYLDFGAINAMRELHAQIRREVARKDMVNHIKLGPGGIREIEFIAQVFQLIRGGRETALQIHPTLAVLQLLAQRRLISPEQHEELAVAYDFLRRLEHRLQYQDDAQTHRLPQHPADQQLVAQSMGFADYPALLAVLNGHREKVSRQFEGVFGEPQEEEGNGEGAALALWTDTLDEETALAKLAGLGFQTPAAAVNLLRTFRASSRYLQLPARNRERLDALGPRLIEAAAATPGPDATLLRGMAFLEAVCRRGAYLALLQQYPTALRKVAEMVGASSWAAGYLTRHPIVLDELLDARLMEVATDWAGFRAELERQLAEHPDDIERQMDILREMHHAQVFRLLAQDLAGLLTIERISDHLTELADTLLATIVRQCWEKVRNRHRPDPQFAVIGYGKLGGKELGYASDLDLVYLYDDDSPSAPEMYARLGQRVTSWLSSQTSAGILFETDLRLRPNGESGLLVSSREAFRDYQLHKAWVWEHQALTRARFIAGDPVLGERFEAIRREILTLPRDLSKLREEVVAMRQKMLAGLARQDENDFDLKHDPGGIVDVEFIVQYLILGHAHRYPQLCGNLGNIALLKMAAELGLIPSEEAEPVREAYRHYRRLQHAKRLNDEQRGKLPRAPLAGSIGAVRKLWRSVFGETSDPAINPG